MNFKECSACQLHTKRLRFAGATVKQKKRCSLAFLAESPGAAEAALGEAMVGKDGKLLDLMVSEAAAALQIEKPSYFTTHMVLCRPIDSIGGMNRAPEKEEILSCAPNVMQIINAARPRVVVFIGKLPEKYYRKEFPGACSIMHPSFLIKTGAQSSPWYITNIQSLKKALEALR